MCEKTECKLWLFEGQTAGLVSMGPKDIMLRFAYQRCAKGRYVLEMEGDPVMVLLKTEEGLLPVPVFGEIIGWPPRKRRHLTEDERKKVITL